MSLQEIMTQVRALPIEERKTLIGLIVDTLAASDDSAAVTPSDVFDTVLQEHWRAVEENRMTIPEFVKQVEEYSSKVGGWPDAFLIGIKHAVSRDAPRIAYALAERGHSLYPVHIELARAARVLAPPKVIAIENHTHPSQGASMRWLRDHSAEYTGQWVALKDGELVGAETNREMLVNQIKTAQTPDTLITWIPDDL